MISSKEPHRGEYRLVRERLTSPSYAEQQFSSPHRQLEPFVMWLFFGVVLSCNENMRQLEENSDIYYKWKFKNSIAYLRGRSTQILLLSKIIYYTKTDTKAY